MNLRCLRFLILFFIPAFLLSAQTLQDPQRKERAQEALNQRLSYAASPNYNPYGNALFEIKSKCFELLDNNAFNEAIIAADEGLLLDTYNIHFYLIKAVAYRELGDTEKAETFRLTMQALIDSILLTGDGKDFATAFQVISVDEEFALLLALGLQKSTQTLVEHDGSKFDVLTVKNKEGDEFEIYFNVDRPMNSLNKLFSPPLEETPSTHPPI